MAVYGLSTYVYKRGNIIDRCNSNGIHDTNYHNVIKDIATCIGISADKVKPWMYFMKKAQRRTISIKQRGHVHCLYYDYKIMQDDCNDKYSYRSHLITTRRPR